MWNPLKILVLTVASCLITGAILAAPADNKSAAMNAMIDLFAKQDPTGVDRYFVSPYVQHNMRQPDELDPLRKLAQQATTWKGVHIIVRRSLSEGDLVLLQSVYSNLVNRPGQAIAFDLFRFNKDGKIVEHWDALEPPAADASGSTQVGGPVDIHDLERGQANRKQVLNFIETVLIGGKSASSGHFIDAKQFVDHSQQRGDGMLRKQAQFVPATTPEKTVRYLKTHQTVAEGNFVFVQGEGRIGAGQVLEIYDLFRLQAGKIVEHWDVLQPLAPKEQWANSNGPF